VTSSESSLSSVPSESARPVRPVRVGVLECDHVAERFRGIGGDYVDMFQVLFAAQEASPDTLELVPFDVIGGALPPRPDTCDGWLCTGSRYSVYDDLDWIPGLLGFVRDVRDAGVPFVGVCFGHQVLARALGGRVERARTGWGAGICDIDVDRPEPWMDPPADRLALHFMHRDQVTVLPPGGEALGRTEHCPVGLLQVGERMVGIQAHPEFTAAYMDALLADRVPLIGEDEVAAARAGLARPTDGARVARWMARVLGVPAGAAVPGA
jgi:GMP synthase-like glutamine amidotransferase